MIIYVQNFQGMQALIDLIFAVGGSVSDAAKKLGYYSEQTLNYKSFSMLVVVKYYTLP